MNYIIGEDRTQMKIKSIDSYVNEDNEIISKYIDKDKIVESIKRLEEKVAYYDNLEATLIKNDNNEINLTDSDAKTVKFGAHQGTDVGYNVQSVVDSKNKLIATFEVTNNSADQGQLYNMSKKAKDIFECKNKSKCTTSSKGRTITRTEMEQFAEIITNRVKNNQAKYSQRQALVEHPFGTLKRSINFYHLLLIDFSKVRGEISIAFFSYNLKRVINILGVKGLLHSLMSLILNLICYIYKITPVRLNYRRYFI